jgi:hypothetical protein
MRSRQTSIASASSSTLRAESDSTARDELTITSWAPLPDDAVKICPRPSRATTGASPPSAG